MDAVTTFLNVETRLITVVAVALVAVKVSVTAEVNSCVSMMTLWAKDVEKSITKAVRR